MLMIRSFGIFREPLQRITPRLVTLGSYSPNGHPGIRVSEAVVSLGMDSPQIRPATDRNDL